MDAKKEINLLGLNVNGHTEKKGSLTYLSWAWATAEMLKAYPDMTYTVERDANGNMYHGDPEIGYMVNTTVTAGGITREMWLPVMDYKNQTMKNPKATDINKTIMRCLTKNFAMFGLGLYIYAGEDLPEGEDKPEGEKQPECITEKEQTVLSALCLDIGKSPAEVFKNWPNVTKEQYGMALQQLKQWKQRRDGNKRSA